MADFDYKYYRKMYGVTSTYLAGLLKWLADYLENDENLEHDYKLNIEPHVDEDDGCNDGTFDVTLYDIFTYNSVDDMLDISYELPKECERMDKFLTEVAGLNVVVRIVGGKENEV